MNLPNLPTDNLYKFITIFGISLIFASAFVLNIESNPSININSIFKSSTLFYILLISGILISLTGLCFWYYMTQIHLDKILVNEKNKLTNEKKLYFLKIQFEKEIEAYHKIWPMLVTLLVATNNLRLSNEPLRKEFRAEKIENFKSAEKNAATEIDHNKPFYQNIIFKNTIEIIKISRIEFMAFEGDLTIDDFAIKKATENLSVIERKLDEVKDMIYKRLTEMKLND